MEFSILFQLFSFKDLIYISLMAQDVESFLICLLDIYISSIENYLLISLAHLLIGFFHFRVLRYFELFMFSGIQLSSVRYIKSQ